MWKDVKNALHINVQGRNKFNYLKYIKGVIIDAADLIDR